MKYMTFNSSCSFAGIANMLEGFGVHMEDYQLALGMKAPHLFSFDEATGAYQTGASLQNKHWFNLFLNTIGIYFDERRYNKPRVLEFLQTKGPHIMLGIYAEGSGKHAVIFTGYRDNHYYFLNNRYQNTDAPAEYVFSGEELPSRLDSVTSLGWLEACPPVEADFTPRLRDSLAVLECYCKDLYSFCRDLQSPEALKESMNRLFRPLLLDGLTMMELLGNEPVYHPQKLLQGQYLSALKKHCPLVLEKELSMDKLEYVLDVYKAMIERQMEP